MLNCWLNPWINAVPGGKHEPHGRSQVELVAENMDSFDSQLHGQVLVQKLEKLLPVAFAELLNSGYSVSLVPIAYVHETLTLPDCDTNSEGIV